jgi:hypothetical protein
VSVLRKWFGPSRAEVWRQLSTEIEGSYVDGGLMRPDRVEGTHGEWTVTLDTYTVHAGKTIIVFTRMRAPYVNPGGFRFKIYRRGVFSDIGKFLGMQDVEVGNEEFDHEFIIKGTDEAKLRRLFANPRLRELIHQQPDIELSVHDDEGWCGAKYPERVDVLTFRVGGVIKDLGRLKALYDLFAETLDVLTRMGEAYERDPNLKL